MDRITFEIEPRRDDFATLKAGLDDLVRQVDHATRPADTLMEQAVRMVFVLGYEPADCRIDTVRGHDRLDTTSREIRLLLVLGNPCFEVKVRRSPIVDLKFSVTVTPRLHAWPPAKVAS
jgi:hypothetical protein